MESLKETMQENLDALDKFEKLKIEAQNDFFNGTIGLLKITLPFALAYLAWVFANNGSDDKKFFLLLVGAYVFLSVLIGIYAIFRILNHWNSGWEIQESHYDVFIKKGRDELKLGQPQLGALNQLSSHIKKMKGYRTNENALRTNLPKLVFAHLFYLSLAVFVSVFQYINNIEVIGSFLILLAFSFLFIVFYS